MLRKLIDANVRLSVTFDRLLPTEYSVDGNRFFLVRILPGLIQRGRRVIDVGGGKTPAISPELKRELGLHVTGFDIDADELRKAPTNYYDEVIVGDVTIYTPSQTYDVVVAAALLEHVRDAGAALRTICLLA